MIANDTALDPPFTVRPKTPTIGAEVEGLDLREELGDAALEAVRRALLEQDAIAARDDDSVVMDDGLHDGTLGWRNLSRAAFPVRSAPAGYRARAAARRGGLADGRAEFHERFVYDARAARRRYERFGA